MASLLTNASAINDSNVSDAVAQISGHASAEAKREAEADAAYYRAPREDPNEEKVREFYEQFTELKNRWSDKRNRSDKLVEEISDATYYYEEWVNAGHLDKDSNYGNPKYQRRYKRWNTKFSNFLKKVRPRNFNDYTPEEKTEKQYKNRQKRSEMAQKYIDPERSGLKRSENDSKISRKRFQKTCQKNNPPACQ